MRLKRGEFVYSKAANIPSARTCSLIFGTRSKRKFVSGTVQNSFKRTVSSKKERLLKSFGELSSVLITKVLLGQIVHGPTPLHNQPKSVSVKRNSFPLRNSTSESQALSSEIGRVRTGRASNPIEYAISERDGKNAFQHETEYVYFQKQSVAHDILADNRAEGNIRLLGVITGGDSVAIGEATND